MYIFSVNFNKLRPRAPLLKESKVLQQLQTFALEDPPNVQELKHKSTFLQKPERPIPKKREDEEGIAQQTEGYRVIIKKQVKKSVTERLLEKGILDTGGQKTPTTFTTEVLIDETRVITPDADRVSRPESQIEIELPDREITDDELKIDDNKSTCTDEPPDIIDDNNAINCEESCNESCQSPCPEKPISLSSLIDKDKEKILELVSTEISLEKQLENVQNQLLALKQLPSEIENHLRIVSEQLHKIMELSGVQNGSGTGSRRASSGR